jgi:hypothetical protein
VYGNIGANPGWEEKACNLCGLHLVNYIKETNRSGRRQHRKQDEEDGTMKMMGLLIQLLVKKTAHLHTLTQGNRM